jgi:nucleoside-diphosphate-sugar epimerase
MKTIAVTGAQGFVGGAVVKELINLGYSVIPIVRKDSAKYSNAIEWDITNPSKNYFRNIDVVIHSAAKVDDWANYADSYNVNVTGTKNVIEAFPNANLFIYISSASVYDAKNCELVITEKSPAGKNLLNDYSRTKYEAERVVINSSLPSRVLLRPHIIYGTGDKNILPRLLNARKFKRFLIIGNGKNIISLTHIDNLINGIIRIVSSDKKFNGEIFNIADEKTDSVELVINSLKKELNISEKNFHIPRVIALGIGTMFEYVAKILDLRHSPLLTPYIVEQMTSNHIIDCSKAREVFGYSPEVEYPEGFKKL